MGLLYSHFYLLFYYLNSSFFRYARVAVEAYISKRQYLLHLLFVKWMLIFTERNFPGCVLNERNPDNATHRDNELRQCYVSSGRSTRARNERQQQVQEDDGDVKC